jgi:hypothetical protein
MFKIIIKNVSGRTVLQFFIISSSLYFLMLLGTIPHLHKITNGVKILDMMPTGYNLAYVKKLMEALGETGRHYYLFRQLPVDLVFPFFFAISNCLIISWFLKKLGKSDSIFFVCYLPLIAGFFDYAENFTVISILINYPKISDSLVQVSNLFSVLKSSSTTVSLTVLLVIVLVWGFRKLTTKPGKIED